jgi:hypothetical protein
VIEIAAIWLLFLAPIALLPGLYNRWAWPTLLCIAAAALFAVWVRSTGRMPRSVLVWILALAVALAVAALLGAIPASQLLGRAPRYEGAVTLPVYLGAAWGAARLLGPRASAEAHRHAVRAAAVAASLLAIVAVLESVGARPIESDLARPGSLAGNATDQGILGVIYLATLGSVALGAWRRTGRPAWWAIGGVVAAAAAIATSASRAAILAGAVVIIALVARWIATSSNRSRDAVIATSVLVIVVAVVMVIPLTRARLLGESGFAGQTIADRLYIWQYAWSLFLTHPWLGVGPSGFADAVTPGFADEWFTRAGVGAILDSPHNIVLQALTAGGIVGISLAAGLAVTIVARGIGALGSAAGARRDLLIGSFVAVGAASLALLTHVTSPVTLVPLATLVGVLVAAEPRPPERRGSRWAMTAVGAVWIVALGIATIADAALLAGRTSVVRGDLPGSLSAFDTAAALRPWDPDVALVAAESLGSAVENGLAGAADPADVWARSALESLPSSSRAHFVAGMVASIRGEYARAQGELEAAARLSPADPRAHHEAGVAAMFAGDLEGARMQLERAVELAPESAESWRALHDVCERIGDGVCSRTTQTRIDDLGP